MVRWLDLAVDSLMVPAAQTNEPYTTHSDSTAIPALVTQCKTNEEDANLAAIVGRSSIDASGRSAWSYPVCGNLNMNQRTKVIQTLFISRSTIALAAVT